MGLFHPSSEHPSPGMRMKLTVYFLRLSAAGALAAIAWAVPAAGQNATNTDKVFLLDSLGRLVKVPTNEFPSDLRPPTGVDLQHQIPTPAKGTRSPPELRERLEQSRALRAGSQFFPAVQPRLMPYLASQDEYGNTAVKPRALIAVAPFERDVQRAKYLASEAGLRYSLEQTLTGVSMTDVMRGDHALGYYTLDFKSKWALFDAPSAGAAGWLSTQIEAKTGLGSSGRTQSASRNLGSLTDPTGIWSSVNGFRIPELDWQQSFRDGEVVVVAGMVSQGNYLDGNAYAQTGRGQFINSALINSLVLPLPSYSFGLNLQWQPYDDWYAMAGASVGGARAGHAPWTDFDWESWSLSWEGGYAPEDVLGLGPGVYRVQPFVGGTGGKVQGGLCFNLQQQLGAHSPFGWFGRFGFGGSEVSAGAKAQVGTGLVMHAPLKNAGLLPRHSNDLLGLGFVWSQPAATSQPVFHQNEYVMETFYTLQLTPMMKLQPDLQLVWNPVHNPDGGPALVAQIQFILSW
jgi:porin